MNKEELVSRYRQMSDDRIEQLASESHKLTPVALAVLGEEMKRRGIHSTTTAAASNDADTNVDHSDAIDLNVLMDTALKEYEDAVKVFYIKETSLKWRANALLIFGVLVLATQIVQLQPVLLVLAVVLLFFGYYLRTSGDEIPQLILYPDYLLFIPSSNKLKNRYADVYKMYINQEFTRINKSEIIEIIKLEQFTNSSPIAIQAKGIETPIPLLLVLSENEVNEIHDQLKAVYTT